jgi:demethylmenaquinone methyltransferase / 2-methoxy-6-polyprenyl-1,4-benzoquinol methylase
VAASADIPPSPRTRHALELFAGLPADYDRMGAILSFGQDPRWRRALVDAISPTPEQQILDVATGTGMVAFALARRSACRVIGLDQSEAMLAGARSRLAEIGDQRMPTRARLASAPRISELVRFVHGHAEQLPFDDGQFDALTFTYLLRYVDDRLATMRELARVVKPGGRIGMIEFGVPSAPALRALWRTYTRVGLPLAGRFASQAWVDVGRFLGPSIERLYEVEPDLSALWRAAGIREILERRMSFGAGVIVWGVRDGDRTA